MPRRVCLGAIALFTMLSLFFAQPLAKAQSALVTTPVLAFYYVWYDHGTWANTPDKPATPYTSKDSKALARHIDLARGAGIDGFVVSWFGPGDPEHNQTQPNLLALLDAAAARNFKIAIHFETQSPYMRTRAQLIDGLRYAVSTLTAHPAYFRLNGKPVIFFWRNDAIAPGEWPAIRAKVDPNHCTYWMAEGVSTAWLNEFDGLHVYNISWSHNFRNSSAKFAGPTRQKGKLWAGTSMPGWDDTHVRGRAGAFARARADGLMFRDSFDGAAFTQPDIMLITSFNEWMEGTQIEPSAGSGDKYLGLARELIARYRAGGYLPTPTPTVAASPTAASTPSATPPDAKPVSPTATPAPPPSDASEPAYSAPALEPTPVIGGDARVLAITGMGVIPKFSTAPG